MLIVASWSYHRVEKPHLIYKTQVMSSIDWTIIDGGVQSDRSGCYLS